EPQFSEDNKTVRVKFVIEEGVAYSVDKILVTGNTHFSTEELGKDFKLQQGKVYNEKKAKFDVKEILKRYKETGFIDAVIEKKRLFAAKDRINVEYHITEGKRFRIGRINITGNTDTKDRVVRRILDEYDFQPGQWYNADTARGDGSGYLEKLVRRTAVTEAAAIVPTGDLPDQKDAQVNITEGQTGMILLGAGVASDSGVIGQLVFEQRNFDIKDKPKSMWELITGKAFKGAGQTLRIALEPGTEVSRYSISFSEPYWKDKPMSFDAVASSFERGRESYDEERMKGMFAFEKRYKNKWRRSIAVRAENVDVTDLDTDAPKEVIDDKGENTIFGVRLGIGKDLRNDRYNPSSGYNFNAGYEQVAGDHTFGILDAVYRHYQTLHEDLAENKTVLAVKLLGAAIVGDAPVFEKFYGGGSGTYGIRGFEYRGVSTRGLQTGVTPAKRKDPIGSDWIFLANGEVTVPLGSETFSGLFFIDSGIIDSGGYRAAAGVGIQILIPQWFGPVPMRFELATPLMKDGEDDTQAFSFSVGRLF
ncbi:MAG: BamA/TamA family outer membrane protein, partial [Phycisphaerales bacterium]